MILGLEASVGDMSLYFDDDVDLKGVERLWILDRDERNTIALCSFPWKTVWFHLTTDSSTGRPTGQVQHIPESDVQDRTLAAAVVSCTVPQASVEPKVSSVVHDRAILQVTTSQIAIIAYDGATAKLRPIHTVSLTSASTACIDPLTRLLVLVADNAARDGDATTNSSLLLYRIDSGAPQLLSRVATSTVNFDATCIAISQMPTPSSGSPTPGTNILIAVGSSEGYIELFDVTQGEGVRPLRRFELAMQGSSDLGIGVESICAITLPSDDADRLTLIAGHRNGQVTLRQLRYRDGDLRLVGDQSLTLSTLSPVNLLGLPLDPNVVYAHCGTSMYCMEMAAPGRAFHISQVYLTDPYDLALEHTAIEAWCQVSSDAKGPLQHRLVALSGSRLLAGLVDRSPHAIPLRRSIPGTPNKMFYSEGLDTLVVSTTVNHMDEHAGKRYAISTLYCMKPFHCTSVAIKTEDQQPHLVGFQLDPGEKALALAPSLLKAADREHHLIIAGCSVTEELEADRGIELKETGSLRWFTLDRGRLKCVKTSHEKFAVAAVCDAGALGFLYGSGRILKRRYYKVAEKS